MFQKAIDAGHIEVGDGWTQFCLMTHRFLLLYGLVLVTLEPCRMRGRLSGGSGHAETKATLGITPCAMSVRAVDERLLLQARPKVIRDGVIIRIGSGVIRRWWSNVIGSGWSNIIGSGCNIIVRRGCHTIIRRGWRNIIVRRGCHAIIRTRVAITM